MENIDTSEMKTIIKLYPPPSKQAQHKYTFKPEYLHQIFHENNEDDEDDEEDGDDDNSANEKQEEQQQPKPKKRKVESKTDDSQRSKTKTTPISTIFSLAPGSLDGYIQVKANDDQVMKQIKDRWAEYTWQTELQSEQQLMDDYIRWRPMGEKVHEYAIKDKGETLMYQVYKVSLDELLHYLEKRDHSRSY